MTQDSQKMAMGNGGTSVLLFIHILCIRLSLVCSLFSSVFIVPKIKVDWFIFSQNARSLSEIANFHFLVFIGSNGCPRTNNVRFCGKTCSTDGDCRGNRKCLCDGDCGMICVKNSKCIWLHLPIGLWTQISRKKKENSEPTINGRVFFLNLTLRVMYLT